jgi:hypothetical protein
MVEVSVDEVVLNQRLLQPGRLNESGASLPVFVDHVVLNDEVNAAAIGKLFAPNFPSPA